MKQELSKQVIDAFRNRKAILWLSQRHELKVGENTHGLGEASVDLFEKYRLEPNKLDYRIASIYWEAVWTDSVKGLIERAIRHYFNQISSSTGPRIRRPVVLAADPDREGALDTHEFLPIYFTLGLLETSDPDYMYESASIRRQAYRLNLLRKIGGYPNRLLVVLGAEHQDDIATVFDTVAEFAPLGFSVLIVWPPGLPQPPLLKGIQVPVEVWSGTTSDFLDALEASHVPRPEALPRISIRLSRGSVELDERDLLGVSDRFSLVNEADLQPMEAENVTRGVLEDFLKGRDNDWRGYAARLVFSRNYIAEPSHDYGLADFLVAELASLESAPNSQNLTVTLPVFPGAGTTTLLRHAAFFVASAGFPALYLRRDQVDFNPDALAAFLGRLDEKAREQLKYQRGVPVLLVFDTEYATLEHACQSAQFLSMRGRPSIVLRAELSRERQMPPESSFRTWVRGRHRQLPPLSPEISQEELGNLSSHFQRLASEYPLGIDAPSLDEWHQYQKDQSYVSPGGVQPPESLFWVALYFFLCGREPRKPPPGLEEWLLRAYESISDPKLAEAVHRIASFAAFGLMVPLMPLLRSLGAGSRLDMDIVRALDDIDARSGLIAWGSYSPELEDQSVRFRHRLLASRLLASIDYDIHEYPVDIIWPVIQSLLGGKKADMWLAEALAYYVLRTERTELPSAARRAKILKTFTLLPPQISEQSKVILHHWARALYHIGLWSDEVEAQLSHLRQAADKLEKAIALPQRGGREEHPSHLYNTLGTILAELHIRLLTKGDFSASESMWVRASQCFERSLELSADNLIALLSFSYRLLLRAEKMALGSPEVADCVGQGLAYLIKAEDVADQPGELEPNYTYVIADCRNRLWNLVSPEQAAAHIEDLMKSEDESGYWLAAYRELGETSLKEYDTRADIRYKRAIDLLEQARMQSRKPAGWRLLYLLYRLYKVHPEFRHRFGQLLGILEDLDKSDFKWHMRMRFDQAVLCYQQDRFREGGQRFWELRRMINQGKFPARRCQDFWKSQENGDKARPATLQVQRIDSEWRGYGRILEMDRQEVVFRPRHFDVPPKVGDFRPCHVRFDTFGPFAVPTSFPLAEI